MRVLVACEFSGTVRNAFRARGHDAISCDILPAPGTMTGLHHCGDVLDILGDGWDLMIAHPPCTYLCSSGARWWAKRQGEQNAAVDFVLALAAAPIEHIAIENPIGCLTKRWRKPDQTIQPWQFGHGETKATCLWLKNLPLLQPTEVVGGREQRLHRLPPGLMRSRIRSKTFYGIAEAMADQWATALEGRP